MRPLPERLVRMLASMAGPVLGVVIFLGTWLANPFHFEPLSAIVGLAGSMVAVVGGQAWAAEKYLDKMSEDVKQAVAHSLQTQEVVKQYLHVTTVGSPTTALEYIESRIPALKEVRNTSFNIRSIRDRADKVFYSDPSYDRFAGVLSYWTSRGLRWTDIGDELAVERLRDLAARSASGQSTNSGYSYKLAFDRSPQLNFIILTYKDDVNEVLFNWDYRSYGQDPTVLLSRDREIITMFTVQFSHLLSSSAPDHDALI
ncbi:hypothetical protein [Arthrobacter woluwensis]|uniref:hypothetical protein n=1 Tax=Arthrobacter woluwensis TaxID=156980 RepID=UPI003824A078